MNYPIRMDASGRLVLPKAVRDRLNLRGEAHLRAEVVGGHVELRPLPAAVRPALRKKRGVTVLARTGAKVDAAAAMASERR